MSMRYRRPTGPLFDRTGIHYGKLVVLRLHVGKQNGCNLFWICKCECGREVSVGGGALTNGQKSCGCDRGRTGWEPILNQDGTVGIPLTRGYIATIDAEDLGLVKHILWRAQPARKTVYAVSEKRGRVIAMHRLLLNPGDDMQVDHKDSDGLNNRRSNLRICTPAQNMCNKVRYANSLTNYKGVSFSRRAKVRKWLARIGINGDEKSLGSFLTEEEAARAYDAAALLYHGEFARLNFPQETAIA